MEATESDRLAPLVGRLLDDRYRLDSVIAKGGMATVFLATDTRLDRQVAVKVMHRALADDPEFVARFTREAKASARLSAAEVVAVHDYGTDRTTGLAYLVMEHVRGINLRQLLLERGALSPARAISLMEPVLRALAAAHSAGLIHRDIKPENVLLADDGRVKVADFGLARAVESSNLTQTTGLLMGTVAYLAPEQVESGTADARTDVYAAGVLLWELLTGGPPYSADTPLSVAYRHVHEDMPAPSSEVSGIPIALDELVLRATRRDPAQRPANGGVFLTELQDVARALPAVAAPALLPARVEHQTLVVQRPDPGTPGAAPSGPRRRRRGLVPLIGLLLLALLALGGGFYLGSYRYTSTPAVLSLRLADADATLVRHGLKAKQAPPAFSEVVAAGFVLQQTPKPGARVRKGGTVTLVVSKGPDRRTIPSLVGKPEAAARTALAQLGLSVAAEATREFSQTVPLGAVTRTDPPVGTALRPGAQVTLVVSRGLPPVAVPDVRGKKQADAEAALRAVGFEVTVTTAFSDTVPVGTVMDQHPLGGRAPHGSTVAVTVSKGPDVIVVPDVRGDSEDTARAKLQALGLKVATHKFPGGPGTVLQTDPRHGAKVKRGSTVTLYIF